MKLIDKTIAGLEKELRGLTDALPVLKSGAPLNTTVLVETLIRVIEGTIAVAQSVNYEKTSPKKKDKEGDA